MGQLAAPLVPNVPLVILSRQKQPLAARLGLLTPLVRPLAASLRQLRFRRKPPLVWTYLAGSGVLDTAMGSRALGSWALGWG